MDSNFILNAIEAKHSRAPLLREISIEDTELLQRRYRMNESYLAYYTKRGLIDEDFVPDPQYRVQNGKPLRRIDGLLLTSDRKYTAIEVKVSRQDFFADSYEKRLPWRRHTHKFIYAVPQGLVSVNEVPEGCGLWEIHENGIITVAKKATVNKNVVPLPDSFWRTVFWRLSLHEKKQRARPMR